MQETDTQDPEDLTADLSLLSSLSATASPSFKFLSACVPVCLETPIFYQALSVFLSWNLPRVKVSMLPTSVGSIVFTVVDSL